MRNPNTNRNRRPRPTLLADPDAPEVEGRAGTSVSTEDLHLLDLADLSYAAAAEVLGVPISCARAQDLVQSHLDGELDDGPERTRLLAHFEMCRRCGVEAEIYERIRAALGADPPPESVDRLEAPRPSLGSRSRLQRVTAVRSSRRQFLGTDDRLPA